MGMKQLRFVAWILFFIFPRLCSSLRLQEGQVSAASTIHSHILRQLTQVELEQASGVNETERAMQGSHNIGIKHDIGRKKGHDEEEAKLNKGTSTSREAEDHERMIHFHSKKGGTHGKPPSGGGFGGGLLGHHHSSSYYKRQRNHAGRAGFSLSLHIMILIVLCIFTGFWRLS
ncbi:hypothetical protein AKJ16_DCAP05542 [Drosera capensis]